MKINNTGSFKNSGDSLESDNFSCYDINGVGVSQFIFNDDGTVSGLISTGSTENFDVKTPISQECCNALNFTWRSSTNECYWSESCDVNPEFKITMGAQGNDGAIFQVEDNESCQLEVKFQYLIQFDCDTLRTCTEEISDGEAEYEDLINQKNSLTETIAYNQQLIDELTKDNELTDKGWSDLIGVDNELISKQLVEVNIVKGKLKQAQQVELKLLDNLAKEGSTKTPQNEKHLKQLEINKKIINQELEVENDKLAELESAKGLKIDKKNQKESEYNKKISEINKKIIELELQLNSVNQKLKSFSEEEVGENCLSVFQTLDIAVTLDKVVQREISGGTTYETSQMLENVFTGDLFKTDDIVEFFRNNCNTGIYVTGGTSCVNQLKQCISNNLGEDCDVFSACTLNSDWLTHSFTITDVETLSGITNEEIKLGFLVRNHECDFNILVDRIEINKKCTEVDSNQVYISKCPSFELERVPDNKKSWTTIDGPQEREYGIKNRETDYNIKHHRLAINTKEIDLEVSPANAIETDVWCYLKDNPEMFNCSTGETSTTVNTDIDFEQILIDNITNCGIDINTYCTLISSWTIDVKLDCDVVYSGVIGVSGETPTQLEYINLLTDMSEHLGLTMVEDGNTAIITGALECNNEIYLNKELNIELNLELTTSCNKQFESGAVFNFEDGTHYEFD